jgi:23S rRNA (adenine2503-C2)-methyltransferase
MGMGEPLLNYDAVIESAKIMKHQNSYGLSRKRITISTSGIVPKINKLSRDIDVSLAISLHAPDDKLRDEIVPINKKYPIKQLIKACKDYLSHFESKKSITMEYIMIDGVNDSINHARKLALLLSNLSCKINLIPFNSFNGSDYRRSKESTMKSFKKYLIEKGFITTLRVTRGDGVDAACGQLVGELSNTIKGKNLIKHRSI